MVLWVLILAIYSVDVAVLEPAKRFYPVQRQATNETATAMLGFTDI